MPQMYGIVASTLQLVPVPAPSSSSSSSVFLLSSCFLKMNSSLLLALQICHEFCWEPLEINIR